MKEKKVSIIVPCYNVEKYIDVCVTSLKKQTYKNIEIIIVNDGSTDETLPKIINAIGNDKRFVIFTKENGGLSSARNYGVKKSTGELITFIDSDDYISDNYISDMVVSWRESFLVQATVESFGDVNGKTLAGKSFANIRHEACGKLYSKQSIVNWFEDTIHEDEIHFFELRKRFSGVISCPDAIYHYRRHNNSIMGSVKNNTVNETKYEKFIELVDKRGMQYTKDCLACHYSIAKRTNNFKRWLPFKKYIEVAGMLWFIKFWQPKVLFLGWYILIFKRR